ncbi:MAG TPA: fused MFS/spermidine synthase [Bryobacteraceae bacterium]|nr:fused MFS/spermidine synthase [Bryobacteraceae bacterium]
MQRGPAHWILWTVAFTEGFSTLAVEVIAIRLAIPVAGSSMILTGVMLGVVLFALSAGYWRGGALSAKWDAARTRTILARNLLLAAVIYGVAFPLEARLLDKLLDSLNLPLSIGITAALLFAMPVYFASQTVPMLAELTSDGKAGRASGKVLFFSTIGSVAGGVVTPVWLFPSIGVTRSTYLVCAVLVAAGVVMAIVHKRLIAIAVAVILVAPAMHRLSAPTGDLFSFDSPYQSVRIFNSQAKNGRMERILMMGGGRASGVYADDGESSFSYTLVSERALAETGASEALVIGSAGFNLPRDAARMPVIQRIDAVDVDPSVKPIAEQYFLKQPLSSKIQFLALSARFAVRKLKRESRHYGFTMIDAYFGKGIPDELVTTEFFADVRAVSDHTLVNAGLDRELESAFARNLLATFRAAFGDVWIIDAKPNDPDRMTNILVLSWPAQGSKLWTGTGTVYHDDLNTADRDRVSLMWGDDAP